MASKQFLAAAANLKSSKNVEALIVGNTNYIDEGTHDVTILAVDIAKVEKNNLDVTYVTAEGKQYRDMMFLMKQDGTEFSFQLRRLLSSTIPNTDAMAKFFELVAKDDKAFEMFTGMKLRITLAYGKGVQARALGNGKFAAFDVESNERVPDSDEHSQLKDVYAEVKGKGLKRSYLQIAKAEATEKEANLAAFERAQVGVVTSSFSAGKVI